MTLDQVLGEQGKAKVSTPAETAQPARPMTKPSATSPDGLTAREVEVLAPACTGFDQRADCRTAHHRRGHRQFSCALNLQQAGSDLQSCGDPVRSGTPPGVSLPLFSLAQLGLQQPPIHLHAHSPSETPPQF